MRYMAIVVLASLFVGAPVLAGNESAETIFNAQSVPVPEPTPNAPTWRHPADAVVLYSQSELITEQCPANVPPGAGSRVIPPLTSAGYNSNGALASPARVADDFVVPAGECWDIQAITTFAYQTGSTTTSTINWTDFSIYNGPPGGGGVVIYPVGAPPNTQIASAWTTIYRFFDSTPCNATRPIMANICLPHQALQLGPGTYWLTWANRGSLASGPWCPCRTIAGQPVTGNGRQLFSGVWNAVLDAGNAQGFPFILEGVQCATAVEPSSWGAIKAVFE